MRVRAVLPRAVSTWVRKSATRSASRSSIAPRKVASSRHGRSVERELTREGLAYHAAIPPNLALAPCLRPDERAARSAGLGLWHAALPGPVASPAVAAGGYQRVRGRVERVAFADAWWVEFAGGFTAVIYPEHQRWWDRETLSGWRGRTIEVRGWVYAARRGGWRMRLPTPDARLP